MTKSDIKEYPIVTFCPGEGLISSSTCNLFGNVQFFKEVNYKAIDRFGVITKGGVGESLGYYLSFKYDINRNMIEECWFTYEEEELVERKTYQFDINRNKIEEKRYYKRDSRSDYKHTYSYDNYGNEIECCHYKSDGSFWYADSYEVYGGFLIFMRRDIRGSVEYRELYEYNDQGNIIKRKEYRYGELNSVCIYVLDNYGNRIEMCIYKSDGSLDYKYTCKYDDEGNRIEMNKYDSEGELISRELYKYNDKGGKIENEKHQYHLTNFVFLELRKYDNEGSMVECINQYPNRQEDNNRTIWSYDQG